MKILIIDNNEDYYSIYVRKLNLLAEVQPYFSAANRDITTLIEDIEPDCILLSHHTCGIYEDIRAMGYRGPIIITVAGKDKHIKRNLLNGISGILDKGLNGEDFIRQLSIIVDHHFKTTKYKEVGI